MLSRWKGRILSHKKHKAHKKGMQSVRMTQLCVGFVVLLKRAARSFVMLWDQADSAAFYLIAFVPFVLFVAKGSF